MNHTACFTHITAYINLHEMWSKVLEGVKLQWRQVSSVSILVPKHKSVYNFYISLNVTSNITCLKYSHRNTTKNSAAIKIHQ